MKFKFYHVFGAVLFVGIISTAFGADFEKGADAYKKGDYVTAINEWKPLAEKGDADAQFNLGLLYQDGHGAPKDSVEAAKWYRKAEEGYRRSAEQGNINALYSLGFIYEMGTGVPQDYKKAIKWYLKAASSGNPDAQYSLGVMYEFGTGLSKDIAKAAGWYKKSAEQGNAEARFRLGSIYEDGEGIQRNYAESAEWYQKAADKGHSPSMYNLGVMYEKGHGLMQDYAKAYMWFSLAGMQQPDKTWPARNMLQWSAMKPAAPTEFKKHAREAIDRIKTKMTQMQIDEAQRSMQEWLHKKNDL